MSDSHEQRDADVHDEDDLGADEVDDAERRWRVPQWLEQLGGWSWRILVAGIVAYFALRVLVLLRLIVIPVLIGLLGAALLGPLKSWFVDKGVPKLIATWFALAVGFAVTAGLIVGASYLVGNELADTEQWTEAREELRDWLQTGPLDLSADELDDLEERAENLARSGLASSVDSGRLRAVGELVGALFLSMVMTFFFVKDGSTMWRWWMARFRPERRNVIDRAGQQAFVALRGFIRGVAITGIVDGVLIGLVLVVLGVPLAIPLAILTFFAAFFPIVGASVVGGVSALIALVANGPRDAIIVAVATLVIQQVEGDVVLPVVMRRTVNLHPVVILVALAMGGSLGGIAGAFVAVPVAAMIAAGSKELHSVDRDSTYQAIEDAE